MSLSYSKLRQKPQSNHWKTQKLTTPYVQLFRILWQSIINILRPGQNQLLLLFFNIFYSNATSHQPNVVLEVLATWMIRTFHPNVVTSPKQHWNWGIGLTTFVTDWQQDTIEIVKNCLKLQKIWSFATEMAYLRDM